MEIVKNAVAGTMESSDIMITLEPSENGVSIELTSTVEEQFGRRIRQVITETLEKLGVENAAVYAVDKGALDCTVSARVEAAVYRAVSDEEQGKINWGVL